MKSSCHANIARALTLKASPELLLTLVKVLCLVLKVEVL